MRRLLVFPAAFGLASASPFAHKAMILLGMSGLDCEVRNGNPMRAPKGKLPVLVDDNATVPDSTFIRLHIEEKYGVDFDEGLSPAERAVSRAFVTMVEEHLYWALVHARWFDAANAERVREVFFGAVPAPFRPLVFALVRRQIGQQLRGHGMGRHSGDEIASLGARDLEALAVQLGDKPFIMGSRPTALDATAYPFLAGIDVPEMPSRLQAALRSHGNLRDYCARCGTELRVVGRDRAEV